MGAMASTIPQLPPPNYINTSIAQLNPPQPQIQIPNVTTQEIVQVQTPQVQPQPAVQMVRPNYPIRKLEAPAVNKAFQPMVYQNRQKPNFWPDPSGPDLSGKFSQGSYLDLKKSCVYPYLVKIFRTNPDRTDPAKNSTPVRKK